MKTRIEADSIGSLEVPSDAYYGVQSLRAKRNFPITGTSIHPVMIQNLAKIKKGSCHLQPRSTETAGGKSGCHYLCL
nr:hypothetical protein [Blautia sp. OF09-25XD]